MIDRPDNIAARVTAGALAVAGGAHIAAYGQHLADGVAEAVFFAVVAAAQIAGALAVLRGVGTRLRVVVVVGNLALIALWAWSRATGLQFGPTAGAAEPVGTLDVTAVAAQVIAVAAAWTAAGTRVGVRLLRPQLVLVAVALLVGAAGLRLPVAAADHHADNRVEHVPTSHGHDEGHEHAD